MVGHTHHHSQNRWNIDVSSNAPRTEPWTKVVYRTLGDKRMVITVIDSDQTSHPSGRFFIEGHVRYKKFTPEPQKGEHVIPHEYPLTGLPWEVVGSNGIYIAYTAAVQTVRNVAIQLHIPVLIHPPEGIIDSRLEDLVVDHIEPRAQNVRDRLAPHPIAEAYMYPPKSVIKLLFR